MLVINHRPEKSHKSFVRKLNVHHGIKCNPVPERILNYCTQQRGNISQLGPSGLTRTFKTCTVAQIKYIKLLLQLFKATHTATSSLKICYFYKFGVFKEIHINRYHLNRDDKIHVVFFIFRLYHGTIYIFCEL